MVKYLLITFFLYLAISTPSIAQSGGIGNAKVTELNHPTFYPNPASDKLFLNAELNCQTVEIYDLSGNLRLSINSFEASFIDVTSLKPSLYLVKIISAKGVNISKLTIKR